MDDRDKYLSMNNLRADLFRDFIPDERRTVSDDPTSHRRSNKQIAALLHTGSKSDGGGPRKHHGAPVAGNNRLKGISNRTLAMMQTLPPPSHPSQPTPSSSTRSSFSNESHISSLTSSSGSAEGPAVGVEAGGVGKGDHSPSSYSPLLSIRGGELPVIAEGGEEPPARPLPSLPPVPPVSSLSLYEKLHLGGGERGPTACESRDSEEEQRMKREGRGIDLTPLEGGLEEQLEREREEEEKGERGGERVGGGDSSLPIVRIFFVGDRGVGKSSLISSFLTGKGESSSKKKEAEKGEGGGGGESLPTRGVEFHTTLFSPQGEGGYRLQLWDAPGEHFAECGEKEGEKERGESSSSLASATSLFLEYYRSAHAFALVCSLSSYASVLSLPYWIDLIRGLHREKEVPILLVGNKADLAEGRVLDSNTMEKYAFSCGLVGYVETSSPSLINLDLVVTVLAQMGGRYRGVVLGGAGAGTGAGAGAAAGTGAGVGAGDARQVKKVKEKDEDTLTVLKAEKKREKKEKSIEPKQEKEVQLTNKKDPPLSPPLSVGKKAEGKVENGCSCVIS